MPTVEVYMVDNENEPAFVAQFDFLPRAGEYISRDRNDYFTYYRVNEVWFRSTGKTDTYQACLSVKIED